MTVVNFEIKPKTVHHKYRRQDIDLTFVPATDNTDAHWRWHVAITRVYEFDGTAEAEDKALKAAMAKIDAFGD